MIRSRLLPVGFVLWKLPVGSLLPSLTSVVELCVEGGKRVERETAGDLAVRETAGSLVDLNCALPTRDGPRTFHRYGCREDKFPGTPGIPGPGPLDPPTSPSCSPPPHAAVVSARTPGVQGRDCPLGRSPSQQRQGTADDDRFLIVLWRSPLRLCKPRKGSRKRTYFSPQPPRGGIQITLGSPVAFTQPHRAVPLIHSFVLRGFSHPRSTVF